MVRGMNGIRMILILGCLVLAGRGGGAWAAEPAPEPRLEIFSHGDAANAVMITRKDLDSIKLDQPIVVSEALTITHVGVGYFEKAGRSGPMLFRPSREVPFKVGQGFGWVMKVDATVSQTEVVEKFSLPKQNGTWTVDPDSTNISDDGLTATTTEVHVFWNFLWRVWSLEEGDPEGGHRFDLSVGGQPVAALDFSIGKK